jgi:hypothetical protein
MMASRQEKKIGNSNVKYDKNTQQCPIRIKSKMVGYITQNIGVGNARSIIQVLYAKIQCSCRWSQTITSSPATAINYCTRSLFVICAYPKPSCCRWEKTEGSVTEWHAGSGCWICVSLDDEGVAMRSREIWI